MAESIARRAPYDHEGATLSVESGDPGGREIAVRADEFLAGPKPTKPDRWPDHIEARITSAGNWGWFDTTAAPTEKNPNGRTYPAWVEGRRIREIYLCDEDMASEYPTDRLRNLAADLRIRLGGDRVSHRAILEQIMEIDGVLKRCARETLVDLWKAGLVTRYGKRFNGRRLCRQEWEVK